MKQRHPSLDLDWQLRLAAFDALRRLTEPTGVVDLTGSLGRTVTREQITAGFAWEGHRIPFALRARGIWKPAQLGRDGAALSITTTAVRPGATPPYDDQIGSDLEWLEYRYQGTEPFKPG